MITCEGKRPVLYCMSVPSACPFIEHLVCSRTFAPRSALSSFSYLSHHDLHFTFILFINTSANISKYALEHQKLSLQEISCKGIMQILRQVVKWKSYTTEMGCGFVGWGRRGLAFLMWAQLFHHREILESWKWAPTIWDVFPISSHTTRMPCKKSSC